MCLLCLCCVCLFPHSISIFKPVFSTSSILDSRGAGLHDPTKNKKTTSKNQRKKNFITLWKIVYLVLCLQKIKKATLIFLLKLMICWTFAIIGREQEQGRIRGRNQHLHGAVVTNFGFYKLLGSS